MIIPRALQHVWLAAEGGGERRGRGGGRVGTRIEGVISYDRTQLHAESLMERFESGIRVECHGKPSPRNAAAVFLARERALLLGLGYVSRGDGLPDHLLWTS